MGSGNFNIDSQPQKKTSNTSEEMEIVPVAEQMQEEAKKIQEIEDNKRFALKAELPVLKNFIVLESAQMDTDQQFSRYHSDALRTSSAELVRRYDNKREPNGDIAKQGKNDIGKLLKLWDKKENKIFAENKEFHETPREQEIDLFEKLKTQAWIALGIEGADMLWQKILEAKKNPGTQTRVTKVTYLLGLLNTLQDAWKKKEEQAEKKIQKTADQQQKIQLTRYKTRMTEAWIRANEYIEQAKSA